VSSLFSKRISIRGGRPRDRARLISALDAIYGGILGNSVHVPTSLVRGLVSSYDPGDKARYDARVLTSVWSVPLNNLEPIEHA
jgi:hypothetical protein